MLALPLVQQTSQRFLSTSSSIRAPTPPIRESARRVTERESMLRADCMWLTTESSLTLRKTPFLLKIQLTAIATTCMTISDLRLQPRILSEECGLYSSIQCTPTTDLEMS